MDMNAKDKVRRTPLILAAAATGKGADAAGCVQQLLKVCGLHHLASVTRISIAKVKIPRRNKKQIQKFMTEVQALVET